MQDYQLILATLIVSTLSSMLGMASQYLIRAAYDFVVGLLARWKQLYDGHVVVVPKYNAIQENVWISHVPNRTYECVTEYLEERKMFVFPHRESVGKPFAVGSKIRYGLVAHDFDVLRVPVSDFIVRIEHTMNYHPGSLTNEGEFRSYPPEPHAYSIGIEKPARAKLYLFVRRMLGLSTPEADAEDHAKLRQFLDICIGPYVRDDWYKSTISFWNGGKRVGCFDVARPLGALPPLERRIFMNVKSKRNLLDDVDCFMKSKDLYRKRNENYMRKYLFYGPPGTGKTQLIHKICEEYKIKINVVDDINAFMRESPDFPRHQDSPMISIVFEDVDLILAREEASNRGIRLSLDDPKDKGSGGSTESKLESFMKFLDGSFFAHNTIVFMTSNKPHLVDERMLRPGRINYRLHVGALTDEDEIRRFVDYSLCECDNVAREEVEEAVEDFVAKPRFVSQISLYCAIRCSRSDTTLLKVAAEADVLDAGIRTMARQESEAKRESPDSKIEEAQKVKDVSFDGDTY